MWAEGFFSDANSSSGACNNILLPITDIESVPNSISEISLNGDYSSVIHKGEGLLYRMNDIFYYGMIEDVDMLSEDIITVCGVPLTSDIQELFSVRNIFFIELNLANVLPDTDVSDLLVTLSSDTMNNLLYQEGFIWQGMPCYIVGIATILKISDSGATTQPKITPTINGFDVFNETLELPVSGIKKSGVIINPIYYRVQLNDVIDFRYEAASGGTPEHEASGLKITLLMASEV